MINEDDVIVFGNENSLVSLGQQPPNQCLFRSSNIVPDTKSRNMTKIYSFFQEVKAVQGEAEDELGGEFKFKFQFHRFFGYKTNYGPDLRVLHNQGTYHIYTESSVRHVVGRPKTVCYLTGSKPPKFLDERRKIK